MKKAAPVKESGLEVVQAQFSPWCMEAHEQFLLHELLPLVVGYAKRNGYPTEATALASFSALATILQSKGASRASLIASIDASRMETHDAPEGLQ